MPAPAFIARDISQRPLWYVQKLALTSENFARECARRYVDEHIGRANRDGQYAKRMHFAYLDGLWGNPRASYLTNFTRPLNRAWLAGRVLRTDIQKAVAK